MTLRQALELVSYRLGRILLARAPLLPLQRLAEAIAVRAFDQNGRRARIALVNLRFAFPDWSEAQRRELGRRSFVHIAWNLLDTLRAETWSIDEIRRHVHVEGIAHVQQALGQGKGAFALVPHLGNFELMSIAAPAYGLPCAAVARSFANRHLYAELVRLRSRTGCRIIDRRRGARAMLRALRDGRLVGVLNDQYSRRTRGVEVPLFGIRCSTSAGLATLVARTGAPVVPATVLRDGPDHHTLRFEPPLPSPHTGDRSRDILLATAAYNAAMERAIRRNPEQYMWAHKRFRHSPDLPGDPYAHV